MHPVERFLAWLYRRPPGRLLRPWVLHSHALHGLVQRYADHRWSRRHIPSLVREYGIAMDEADVPKGGFKTLNEFFTRRLLPTARTWDPDPNAFASPADAKLFVLPQVERAQTFVVKGVPLFVEALLHDRPLAESYDGGSAAIFRLHVADCHRLYFPCDGVPGVPRRIRGAYYSVTPFPGNDVSHFTINQRTVTRFASDSFGDLLLVDVGGFLIGTIRMSFTPNRPVKKGEEKSQFRFGGSTLAILARPGRIRYRPEIVAASRAQEETAVKIGQTIGWAP